MYFIHKKAVRSSNIVKLAYIDIFLGTVVIRVFFGMCLAVTYTHTITGTYTPITRTYTSLASTQINQYVLHNSHLFFVLTDSRLVKI